MMNKTIQCIYMRRQSDFELSISVRPSPPPQINISYHQCY